MKMGDKFKAQIMLYFNIKLLKYSDTYANRNYVKGKSNIFKNFCNLKFRAYRFDCGTPLEYFSVSERIFIKSTRRQSLLNYHLDYNI